MTCLSAGVDALGTMTLCPVSGGNRFCVQPVRDLAAAPPKLTASSTASFWSLPRTDRADPLRVATFSALRPDLCPPLTSPHWALPAAATPCAAAWSPVWAAGGAAQAASGDVRP